MSKVSLVEEGEEEKKKEGKDDEVERTRIG